MLFRCATLVSTILISQSIGSPSWAQVSADGPVPASTTNSMSSIRVSDATHLSAVSKLDGVQFVKGSASQILLEKDGRRYLIDTQNQTIHEVLDPVKAEAPTQAASSPAQGATSAQTAAQEPENEEEEVYYTEDIVLWNLPTAHHLEKKALIVDFTHRFTDRAFHGPARVSDLFGLDGFSISAFGLTYGVTDTFFVGAYRVPAALGRIIQLHGGAQLSQEAKGHPFSSKFRIGVEGANHFSRNFVTSLEFALAKSIRQRAQLYFVPTISFNNRRLVDPFGKITNELNRRLDVRTTTAIGAGLSVDIRPTVALLAEAIQRTSGLLGVHRPSFMFGIQKKIERHSFTLGVTNSPGTTMSQRSGTNATLMNIANRTDTFRGLTLGFNLSRRLF